MSKVATINKQIKNLIEHNDELENYFRNTIIPQLFVDADLILRKFTPPAMKQFSLSLNDVVKPIKDIKDNFRYPSIIDNIQEVINSNEILEKEIQTIYLRWYQMNILPYIIKENNKTNGVIITFVEITARIKDLKEQEKLISDHETLLDTLSHDIKNPLTTLLLAVAMFKDKAFDDQDTLKKLVAVLDCAVNKMNNFITELTDTREQEYKYKTIDELLDFGHILEDVRLTLSDKIIESAAVIKGEVNISEVTFSRRKLRSIVFNLLNNAIKFKSPDRKRLIFIKTTKETGYIIISVKDNGIGIPVDKKEEIFSKYFGVDNAVEGTGVGLYLIKEIVSKAGGKIELQSEEGKGTEFFIYLKQS